MCVYIFMCVLSIILDLYYISFGNITILYNSIATANTREVLNRSDIYCMHIYRVNGHNVNMS